MELYHHGIKGQKWGVRRWQNSDGSLTSAGYIHYGYGKNKKNSSKEQNKKTKSKDPTEFVRYHGTSILDQFANQLRVENGLAATKSLADGLTKHGFWDADSDYDDSDFQTKEDRIWNTGERKSELNEYDISTINKKNYDSDRNGKNGYRDNCMQASIATELRLAGYKDFEAGPCMNGNLMDDITEYFDGAKITRTKGITEGKDVRDYMLNKYGENSSGVLGVHYTLGSMAKKFNLSSDNKYENDHTIVSGHAVHWQIDKEGNFIINDMQDGEQFTGDKAIDYFKNNAVDLGVGFSSTRLDDKQPNMRKLLDNGIITAQHKSQNSYLYDIDDEDEYYNEYKKNKKSETTAYKSFGGSTNNEYGPAYNQTKKDIYKAYREYKKTNYGV